jgi:hypothetical protein
MPRRPSALPLALRPADSPLARPNLVTRLRGSGSNRPLLAIVVKVAGKA